MPDTFETIRADLPELPDLDLALLALSTCEALTDSLAVDILRHVAVSEDPIRYVSMFHWTHITRPRNGEEWELDPTLKHHFQPGLYDTVTGRSVARTLLKIAQNAYAGNLLEQDVISLPWYILSGVGVPYHETQLDAESGMEEYLNITVDGSHHVTWLASQLAHEQAAIGLLSGRGAELSYMNGMALYRSGRIDEAVPALKGFATSKGRSKPVAVAKHLVGRYYVENYPKKYQEGINLLQRSLDLGNALKDSEHIGHVSHTLAWAYLLKNWPKRQEDVFKLLSMSLEQLEKTGDQVGRAKVLHTLGRAQARRGRHQDTVRAEATLRESIRIGEQCGMTAHVLATLHTLSNVLQATSPAEAQRLVERQEALRQGAGYRPVKSRPAGSGRGRELTADSEKKGSSRRILNRRKRRS